jgi:8-oxo-dGTP diphosphatase
MMDYNKRPGVGVGLLIIRDGKILLGKRHDDAEKADSLLHGEGTWTVPGGKLDFHETPMQAAAREAEEECGIKAKNIEFLSVTNDMVHDAHFITLAFVTRDFDGEPTVREPDEITEWKWFPFTELPSPIFFPSEKAIKNYMEKRVFLD